ncbi:MAG: 3-isopropylmalate dehydratase small subunit [Deltaproteobacteria bacterium]|nr:3-isopropylmalate dehydratase small subunit [Deltaproteobacteria bacterium]MBW2360107.1 3-isopropylmalate dehydratase small subunit [Deltaproteobacteria bacterium]
MSASNITRVAGRGCALRGNDIDTDRIIPARFLRCVSFDGLGEHAFEDDREQAKGDHPLDDERNRGAAILVVDHNFGSGSSREHAPQALTRRGFKAFVGGSFAEIFAGNCVALGLPCVTLDDDDRSQLMDSLELDRNQEVVVDLEARTVTSRSGRMTCGVADGARQQLLGGSWDATAVLLEAGEAIEATAAKLPYVSGYAP